MQKILFIALCLLGLCAGCSSVTNSGLTKRELRELKLAVAQQTTNAVTRFEIPLNSKDIVEAVTENEESFTLSRTQDGWKVTNRRQFHFVLPKSL